MRAGRRRPSRSPRLRAVEPAQRCTCAAPVGAASRTARRCGRGRPRRAWCRASRWRASRAASAAAARRWRGGMRATRDAEAAPGRRRPRSARPGGCSGRRRCPRRPWPSPAPVNCWNRIAKRRTRVGAVVARALGAGRRQAARVEEVEDRAVDRRGRGARAAAIAQSRSRAVLGSRRPSSVDVGAVDREAATTSASASRRPFSVKSRVAELCLREAVELGWPALSSLASAAAQDQPLAATHDLVERRGRAGEARHRCGRAALGRRGRRTGR